MVVLTRISRAKIVRISISKVSACYDCHLNFLAVRPYQYGPEAHIQLSSEGISKSFDYGGSRFFQKSYLWIRGISSFLLPMAAS